MNKFVILSILSTISFYDGVSEGLEKYWHNFLTILPKATLAIIVITISFLLAGQIRKIIKRKLDRHASDPLLLTFISQISKWFLIFGGILFGVEILGFNNIAGSLVAGAGISAFIIGFAFKDIGENFLAGIIIAFNRNFHINDTIRIEDFEGDVMAINLRTVHIRTDEGNDVFIPNSKLINNVLINITATGLTRKDFIVLIDYHENIHGAATLIIDNVKNIAGVLKEKLPQVNVNRFTLDGIELRISFWYNSLESHKGIINLQSQVMEIVKDILLKKNFTFPGRRQEINEEKAN